MQILQEFKALVERYSALSMIVLDNHARTLKDGYPLAFHKAAATAATLRNPEIRIQFVGKVESGQNAEKPDSN